MASKRTWTDEQLRTAVAASRNYRETMQRLGLSGSGDAHWSVRHRIRALSLDTTHFEHSRFKPWTDDQLRLLVPTSTSFVELLTKLGLDPANGMYPKLRRRVALLGLDVSHFLRVRGSRARRRFRWTDETLVAAVRSSRSFAGVMRELGLIPAGGNYDQVQRRISELQLDTSHFTGQGWSKGIAFHSNPPLPLAEVLVAGRPTSSHLLKQRLFREGLKKPACELCGWAERSADGRLPLELDHINGDKNDNRIENLRIVCPNCHAMQPTHRGLNKKHLRKQKE